MKLKYLLLFAFGTLISCTKSLDIEPKNSITFENGLRTEKDIQSLLGSIQGSIRIYAPFYPNGFAQKHMHYYTKGSQSFDQGASLTTMESMPSTPWNSMYEIIHKANIPLKYIEKIELSTDKRDYYLGQAYFYKAFAYLWLARIWGDAVLIKDDVILGPIEKSTWPILIDYAIEQVEKAIELLPEQSGIGSLTGNEASGKFVATKGAAYALLAELAAWKAGCHYFAPIKDTGYDPQKYWAIVENACSKIISSNQYQMAANPEEVCEKVLVGNSTEGIFEVDAIRFWDELVNNSPNFNGVIGPIPHHPALMQPISYLSLLQGFRLNSLDSTNNYFAPNDLRRQSYFYKVDSLAQTNTLQGNVAPNKFRRMKFHTTGYNMGKPQGVFQNWIVWRLAGIYLMRAESRVRTGNISGAIEDLNVVRKRAKATEYNVVEGDLRYAIFNEKTKREFLFEPHSYWFDVVRNGYAASELKRYGYDKLKAEDLRDGALFDAIQGYDFADNPKLRQNVYWFKRFGF